ncbi:DUF2851 family protein [Gramella jeungdoensis]|uniref:DUF2851 family protein n=1 Tax=Gramella jeungdoensis TaxID=708091 RepID=A0ABT0YZV3_9FLAO|nr:DUF2851 family protein [Gramella jeungdoensis]
MREDFLYHLWKFQKFNSEALKTSEGEVLLILHPGSHNEYSGPDFFNAKIQIAEQLWAGNVEIHLKSSYWYVHHHETDPNYDNVILHVVWEHDADIFRKDGSVIPTLVLNDKVSHEILESYKELLERKHLKINCEKDFDGFEGFQMQHWLERLYFERLEKRSIEIQDVLEGNGNNWEATFFVMLCRSFGLNLNGEAFRAMAASLDFRIIQKLANDRLRLEALFLGQAGIIKSDDKYALELAREYDYLKHKFSLNNGFIPQPQFFRLRPDNFPTIRLAQLAAIYTKNANLFQQVINANALEELYILFEAETSEYWTCHYNFGRSHPKRQKKPSRAFIDLVLINCLVPFKDYYSKYMGQADEDLIQELISAIPVEKNSIINIFNVLRPGTAQNAMHSQALLELKKEYCDLDKCLYCELGASLLKKSPKYI